MISKIICFLLFLSSYVFACEYASQKGCNSTERCIYVLDPEKPLCLSTFTGEYPKIVFPFDSSRLITCDQGPHMPGEKIHSHAWKNAMDALDLRTNHKEPSGLIYAGASGKALVYNECKTKNDQCGGGFGNHIKIFREDGTMLFYAHFEKVMIKDGDEVKVGDLLGIEGESGWAGENNRHLHMSVHYDWRIEGKIYWSQIGWLPASIPFQFDIVSPDNSKKRTESSQSLNCVRKYNTSIRPSYFRGTLP